MTARAGDEHDHHAAAEQALRRYPGPVGELLYRELTAYARFGHRFATGVDTLIPLLSAELLNPPDPSAPAAVLTRPGPGPVLWPRPR